MKCLQCGNECNDSASFCNQCGAKLVKPVVETPSIINEATQPEVEPVQPVEQYQPVEAVQPVEQYQPVEAVQPVEQYQPVEAIQPVEQYQPVETIQPVEQFQSVQAVQPIPISVPQEIQPKVKKKSKLPFVLIGVILVLAVTGAVVVFGKNFIKSDSEKLMDASLKTQQAKQIELVGEFGFNEFDYQSDDPVEKALVENIIQGAKIQFGMKSDSDAKEVEGEIGFDLSGSQLIGLSFHMNEEYVAIEAPKLYSKAIYMNWEDVRDTLLKYGLITEEDISDINITRVLELINAYSKAVDYTKYAAFKKFDKKPYDEIIKEYQDLLIADVSSGNLEMDIQGETYDFSGKVYSMNLEMDKYIDLGIRLLEIIIADETLLPMIVEGTDTFIDTTIKEKDYYIYNLIASSNGEETVKEWDDDTEENLIAMKEDFLTSLSDEFQTAMSDIEDEMTQDEFIETTEALKEVYSEIDYTAKYVVDKGYLRAMEATIIVDDSIVDAINDLEQLTGDPTGLSMGALDSVDSFFTVSTYMRVAYTNVNEKIEFSVLPSDAVDFSKASEEDLMEIYQELSENVQALTQSLGGF